MRLKGKTAFVTGASRGIGKALAIEFARQGANVVVAAKTENPHEKLPGTIHDTVKEIEQAGGRALAVRLDVRDDAEIDAAVAKTIETFGALDVLVHNAGAIFLAEIADTPPKRFDLMMGVNARASFALSRAFLPHLKSGAHILMISPPIALKPMPGKALYLYTKFGMTWIAMSLAEELRDRGIRVNALWPVTAIDSQAVRHFWPGREEEWRTPQIVCDAVLEVVTSDRTGQTLYDEDVLREAGVTDLGKYALVPGSNPPPFSKILAQE